jgi:crossover junction endodeoxyribonuclease RusA
VLKLVLPYPPSVNRLWRASKGGKVYRSDKYTDWRKAALWGLAGQAKGKRVAGPYTMLVEVVAPDKRRRDLGNIEKAVSDLLQAAKLIDDDCLCREMTLRWVPKGPECMILLKTHEEKEEN